MRKFTLLLLIPALLVSLFFLSSAPAKADEPVNIFEQRSGGGGGGGPRPTPSPKPGPREGGADD